VKSDRISLVRLVANDLHETKIATKLCACVRARVASKPNEYLRSPALSEGITSGVES